MGLAGDIGEWIEDAVDDAVPGATIEGILFQGGITFLDESGCMVTSGRNTIVFDRFMFLGFPAVPWDCVPVGIGRGGGPPVVVDAAASPPLMLYSRASS